MKTLNLVEKIARLNLQYNCATPFLTQPQGDEPYEQEVTTTSCLPAWHQQTRSATDAASPTPPASDSPPACSTPGPDPALSATPSRSSASISSPAGETTAFHASTGENPTPATATKPDSYKLTRSAYACRLVGSL
ncbi:hypothetical protein J6590_096000 [Homalodisca vitripennis]|nr:hypothetical protein J6590_085684 [Homalodisca vitripennis]KAG8314300.1 hypothetical protein J6590_096000 [Homalodisca vitripennis]